MRDTLLLRWCCAAFVSENASKAKRRGMLVCRVVVGKTAIHEGNKEELLAPPRGYDSVWGKASESGPLNMDECVVYHNHAILPEYMILYSYQPIPAKNT